MILKGRKDCEGQPLQLTVVTVSRAHREMLSACVTGASAYCPARLRRPQLSFSESSNTVTVMFASSLRAI